MRLNRMVELILRESARQMDPDTLDVGLLEAVWGSLVGPQFAPWTRPRAWRQGTLYVEVQTARWNEDVQWRQEELMAVLQRRFPWPIERLQFMVLDVLSPTQDLGDPVIEGLHRTTPRPELPLSEADQAEAMASLEGMDEELRAQALRIREFVKRRGQG